jgi:enterochelin esterase-like enzyme
MSLQPEPTASPDDQYVLGRDSQPRHGVPEGELLEFHLADSTTFPGFARSWSLYLPADYRRHQPMALMIFQDGKRFAARDGIWRVPTVLDNLIASKELPSIAAAFIDPGVARPKPVDGSALDEVSNRSVEYDTLSAAYSQFLLDEILPAIRRQVDVTDDPAGRAIGGHSSGAICAFTAAWQRPDQFGKVLSANGSFTNIRGGHAYPQLVRSTPRKPIRIFQQGGANDLVHPEWGEWGPANQAMAAALDEAGYDHWFVFGNGTHSARHAASILPDALRWLWRGYPS